MIFVVVKFLALGVCFKGNIEFDVCFVSIDSDFRCSVSKIVAENLQRAMNIIGDR